MSIGTIKLWKCLAYRRKKLPIGTPLAVPRMTDTNSDIPPNSKTTGINMKHAVIKVNRPFTQRFAVIIANIVSIFVINFSKRICPIITFLNFLYQFFYMAWFKPIIFIQITNNISVNKKRTGSEYTMAVPSFSNIFF